MEMFFNHKVKKLYITICSVRPPLKSVWCVMCVYRGEKTSGRMTINSGHVLDMSYRIQTKYLYCFSGLQ